MSDTSCWDGAKGICSEKKNEYMNNVENVHISVFFDGTGNNAVQQDIFDSYKRNGSFKKKYKETIELKNDLYKLQTQSILASNGVKTYDDEEIKRINEKIDETKKKLQDINYHPSLDTSYMASNNCKGYSNISILYSLLQTTVDTNIDMYHSLYVEGSGATDISEMNETNINGLGFGLGETGVTALVSKALWEITDYLSKNKGRFDENTKYHFYVFGFSRGATCARLFTELTTRIPPKKLEREREFAQDTSRVSTLMVNGRIPFMEENYLKGSPMIKRENVTVDFLGIYDTVASIGFLKQRDGWTNALSLVYRGFWWNNYHGNFHYTNVRDYGLYSHHNENVLHTCHICAGDEFRENFALVNLGKKIPDNATEIIIPGCHSDVGGGYVTGVEMDVVLYKFVPRKLERLIKHNKISEILGYSYLRNKERAKVFLDNPSDINGKKEELSPNALAKLGWLGHEWLEGMEDKTPEKSVVGQEICTKRVADWPNELKFKRYVIQGYSNIPLRMMISCVERCKINWLFRPNTSPYNVPGELVRLGKEMIKVVENPFGKRLWLIPDGHYTSESYRELRLNYLHFTSSCELMHFRTKVDKDKRTIRHIPDEAISGGSETSYFEFNAANFGNNCNYDDNANICRIMYNGDEELFGDHKDNVHYMYEFSKIGLNEVKLNDVRLVKGKQ